MKLPTRLKAEERKISKYHGLSRNQMKIMSINKWTCHSKQENTLFLTISVIKKAKMKLKVKGAQLCPTVCDPMDQSPWNSPSQNLEWVAFPSSRGSSQPKMKLNYSKQRNLLLGDYISTCSPRLKLFLYCWIQIRFKKQKSKYKS